MKDKKQGMKCPRCNVEMKMGVALKNRPTGIPDFIGDDFVCTVSYCKEADLIECLKCPECGHSLTKG